MRMGMESTCCEKRSLSLIFWTLTSPRGITETGLLLILQPMSHFSHHKASRLMSLFPRGDPLASCSPLFAFNCANGCFVAKEGKREESSLFKVPTVCPTYIISALHMLSHFPLCFTDERTGGERAAATWTAVKRRLQTEAQAKCLDRTPPVPDLARAHDLWSLRRAGALGRQAVCPVHTRAPS